MVSRRRRGGVKKLGFRVKPPPAPDFLARKPKENKQSHNETQSHEDTTNQKRGGVNVPKGGTLPPEGGQAIWTNNLKKSFSKKVVLVFVILVLNFGGGDAEEG